VRSALIHLAYQRPFSSVVEWLESLRWDGTGRINQFFPDHYESEDDDYSRECARVFFLSAVARAFEPGCQADIMPVLIGNQGVFKSTGMAALCPNPDWFADDLGCDIFANKAAEGLQGKWLFEFGEFARINRSTMDVVKSFITRRVDHYRPPYGRIPQDFPRMCVFFGTTNNPQPLQDIENRRFFPLKVIQGNVSTITAMRDQLWAEAVSRYKAGEKWHVTSSDLAQKISSYVESARSEDAWEAILEDKLIGRARTTMIEAAQMLGLWDDRPQLIVNKLGRAEQTRIGVALASLGFEKKRDPLPPRAYFYERGIRPTSPGSP
jgi:predicted P-loop ATPase